MANDSPQRALAALVERHCPDTTVLFHTGQQVRAYAVLRTLLRHLTQMHAAWRQHYLLTSKEVGQYKKSVAGFADCWRALTWKPTMWVHWVVCHSGFFMARHRSLFLFSSIPSEKKHQRFKRDIAHSFQGWKVTRPTLAGRAVAHAVALDAVDKGLALQGLRPSKRARLQ